MLLEITNLYVTYNNVQAVKGIDIHVEQGEIVTVLGANGAGKSTTLLAISGLVIPCKGEIVFDGKPLRHMEAHDIVREGIVHVPEGRRVFGTMTVLENLSLGGFLVQDRARFQKTLGWIFELFPRLRERKKQLAGTLSGGEQQMLAIARGLMGQPRLMLLDEPSLGLAPILVRSIFSTIQEINASGVTIILVEQNARAALHLAHRGYVLETGNCVLSGTATDLLQDRGVQNAYLGARV